MTVTNQLYEVQPKHATLEKLNHQLHRVFTDEEVSHMLSGYFDIHSFLKSVCLNLERKVWAEKIEASRKTVDIPATWFQHFKEECFPLWLKIRFPVKYKQMGFRFERFVKYPSFDEQWGEKFKEFVWYENLEGIDE